jgi:DNA-binding transcriptional LysR family regulator
MELRHLKYFIAVAEELHFAQAAERLGISPPTLTVQIQEIERSLQARLFLRSKRSVALTTAGAAFLEEARQTLAQFEHAQHVGRRAGRGETGRIEIGYVGSATFSGVLQQQLRRFRLAWPEVVLNARELVMDELPGLIEEGRVDVAFVRLPMHLSASLQVQVLWRDSFCVALPAEHPLAGVDLLLQPVKARELAEAAFIVPEQVLGTHEVGRRGRFEPRIVAAPGALVAVLSQVSLGEGVAIVPDVLASAVAMPNVVFRPLAGKPVTSEVAALFRKRELAPAVMHFIRQLQSDGKADGVN